MTELERFVKRLVEVLGARDPAGLHRPVTVSDLRSSVLPYRLNRSVIGLSSSEDYELLVLRLVAEEGGYTRSYPPTSAERARAEMASPNPDLDLVEQLADTTIQLGASGLARVMGEGADQDQWADRRPTTPERPAPEEPTAEPVAEAPEANDSSLPLLELEPEPEPESATPPAPEPSEPAEEFEPIADTISIEDVAQAGGVVGPELEAAATPVPIPPATAVCEACNAELPSRRPATYCPFCGHKVGARRCAQCGGEIDDEWKYCIGCGSAAVALRARPNP
jgi:hypothetical protein